MIDERDLLEQTLRRFEPEPGLTDRVYRRRDRNRRNQRIAAGVVGIVVFVAAVGIVTTFGSSDRTQPGASGGAATGQGVTGPTETGPTGPTGASPDGWDGYGLPPEGTALSTPAEGQPILQQDYEGEVRLGEQTRSCPGGCSQWYHRHLVVYADGRVLWWGSLRRSGGGDYVLERRLTPEGVDLVRSGVDPDDLPDSAWADASCGVSFECGARPYAPPRYSVCFWADGVRDPSANPMLAAVDLLPAPAKPLLRGIDPDPSHPGCLVVSTEDARAFYDIMSEQGLEAPSGLGGVGVTPGDTVDSWLLRDAERILGEQVGIYLHPLWPDGDWHQLCCA